MKNWRKWINAFLIIIIIILFILIVAEFLSMMKLHKQLGEKDNNKPIQNEQGKENEVSDKTEDKNDTDITNYLLDYDPLEIDEIPSYSGEPYIEINDGLPGFSKNDLQAKSFEYYSDLDDLGRCGVATADISKDMMPTEPRGNIGHIRPSGWHTVKYPELISDRYLYNRCHLIAYSLCGENDNERNLITGTRYMNATGMLPFENEVVNYIERTNNHVLYRVTPYFVGTELVARGVQIEAYSVEDNGGLCMNVYVYNVQPGIGIDYANGDSWIEEKE